MLSAIKLQHMMFNQIATKLRTVGYLKLKFGEVQNILDVMMRYEIFGFCRLGLKRLKFYRIKTWDDKNQISSDSEIFRVSGLRLNF
jgi:hypothetical protein